MDFYFLLKTIHILSSTVLFGTGLGIAFLNFWGQRQSLVVERYFAARLTVLMDFLFTTPAVLIQPLSGVMLLSLGGYNYDEQWLVIAYILYGLAGLCWLPVVWIQIRIRNILKDAVEKGLQVSDLPPVYHRLHLIWFVLGWPAFTGLVTVFYLMITKGASL